jgi:hypothetical protein
MSDGDATLTTESPNPTSIAPSPVGGGASCVQECLKKAAVGVGCKNSLVWVIEFERTGGMYDRLIFLRCLDSMAQVQT